MVSAARAHYIRVMNVILAAAVLFVLALLAWGRVSRAREASQKRGRKSLPAPRGDVPGEPDPRETAARMLLLIALSRNGELTLRQGEAIRSEIIPRFGLAAEEAQALLDRCTLRLPGQEMAPDAMRRMSRQIVTSPRLNPEDIVDLDTMLVSVSEAEGLPTRTQLSMLQIYRDVAGLKT